MDWAYILSGLLVGFIVGMTGVGGGSLMTPLLVMGFGIAPSTAVGTDLLYASITKAGGALVHDRRRHVQWKVVGRLALGSVPAALVTIGLIKLAGIDKDQLSAIITPTLGVTLVLTSLALFFKERLQAMGRRKSVFLEGASRRRGAMATVATGVVLGALVTVSSVGAGSLGAVALFFLYPLLPAIKIIGSDIAHAVPLTAAAGLGHLYMGTVDFGLLTNLLIGSLPGIALGSWLGGSVPERFLRLTLACMLLIVGARLLFSGT